MALRLFLLGWICAFCPGCRVDGVRCGGLQCQIRGSLIQKAGACVQVFVRDAFGLGELVPGHGAAAKNWADAAAKDWADAAAKNWAGAATPSDIHVPIHVPIPILNQPGGGRGGRGARGGARAAQPFCLDARPRLAPTTSSAVAATPAAAPAAAAVAHVHRRATLCLDQLSANLSLSAQNPRLSSPSLLTRLHPPLFGSLRSPRLTRDTGTNPTALLPTCTFRI